MSSSAATFDHLAKVLILGDSAVGKSSILLQFCEEVFPENHVATIGLDFKMKIVECQGRRVKMQIWDSAGQERYRKIARNYYNGASGIILVYDITNLETFTSIEEWVAQINEHAGKDITKILVANKSDRADRKISFHQGQGLADRFNIPFVEISAMNNTNVNEAFQRLTEEILKTMPAPGSAEESNRFGLSSSSGGRREKQGGCCK